MRDSLWGEGGLSVFHGYYFCLKKILIDLIIHLTDNLKTLHPYEVKNVKSLSVRKGTEVICVHLKWINKAK